MTFSTRNDAIAAARAALLETAAAAGVLADFPYTGRLTGGPGPVSESTIQDEATVDELLGALRIHFDVNGDTDPGEAELLTVHDTRLREVLLALGDIFELYRYSSAAAPETSRAEVESYSTPALVAWFDRVWHEQAGCLGHLPSDREEDLVVEQTARNLKMITAFGDELRFSPEVVSNYAKIRPTPLYNESRVLCRHTIETFFPDAAQDPRIRAARSRATEVAADQEEDIREIFGVAVAEAAAGLLTYGIASEAVTQSLLEPFEEVLPLRHLLRRASLS